LPETASLSPSVGRPLAPNSNILEQCMQNSRYCPPNLKQVFYGERVAGDLFRGRFERHRFSKTREDYTKAKEELIAESNLAQE